MIRVLAIENAAVMSQAQLDLVHTQLPAAVADSSARYRRWQDAQAFLLGRYLLAAGLKALGYKSQILSDIQYTKYNRPYLPVPIDFNISHSGNYVLCAFSTAKAGIDIEAIRQVDIDDFTICFSARELATINDAPDKYNEFFRHWTIKEAAIKADGRGLSLQVDTIPAADPVIDGTRWFVHKIDIDKGYMAHIATSEVLDGPVLIERIVLPHV